MVLTESDQSINTASKALLKSALSQSTPKVF